MGRFGGSGVTGKTVADIARLWGPAILSAAAAGLLALADSSFELSPAVSIAVYAAWLVSAMTFSITASQEVILRAVRRDPRRVLDTLPNGFLKEMGGNLISGSERAIEELARVVDTRNAGSYDNRVDCLTAMRTAVRGSRRVDAICGDKNWDVLAVRRYFATQLKRSKDDSLKVRRVFIDHGSYPEKEKPILALHIVQPKLKWRLIDAERHAELLERYDIPQHFGFAVFRKHGVDEVFVHWGLDRKDSPVGVQIRTPVMVESFQAVFDAFWEAGHSDRAKARRDLFNDDEDLLQSLGDPDKLE